MLLWPEQAPAHFDLRSCRTFCPVATDSINALYASTESMTFPNNFLSFRTSFHRCSISSSLTIVGFSCSCIRLYSSNTPLYSSVLLCTTLYSLIIRMYSTESRYDDGLPAFEVAENLNFSLKFSESETPGVWIHQGLNRNLNKTRTMSKLDSQKIKAKIVQFLWSESS